MKNAYTPDSENPREVTSGDVKVDAATATSDNVVYSIKKREPSLFETLTFALLCLLAGGLAWFFWTHTEHRPALSSEISK
jgi:hypothetical protein